MSSDSSFLCVILYDPSLYSDVMRGCCGHVGNNSARSWGASSIESVTWRGAFSGLISISSLSLGHFCIILFSPDRKKREKLSLKIHSLFRRQPLSFSVISLNPRLAVCRLYFGSLLLLLAVVRREKRDVFCSITDSFWT